MRTCKNICWHPLLAADAGYATAVAGKWHNGRTPGYTPADAGFKDTFLPSPYVFKDNIMSINGMERQTRGAHFGWWCMHSPLFATEHDAPVHQRLGSEPPVGPPPHHRLTHRLDGGRPHDRGTGLAAAS